MPKPKYPCGTCNKSAAKDSILCNFCDFWHHATPECMVTHTPDQILMLKELCKDRTCWSCYKCSEIMKKLNGRLAAVEKELKTVKTDIVEVKQKQSTTDKKVDTVEKDVQEIKKIVKSNTENTKTSIMSEVNQREMRKTNLIVHGLKEPEVDAAAHRDVIQEKEKEGLNSLFDSMTLKSAEVNKDIKFRRRLGEKKDNKPRPLLIGFKNISERNLVMETSFKTKNLRVSFTADLTKMQREDNDKLRKEVEQLNGDEPSDESGDYRWKVVGPPEMLRKAKTRDLVEWKRKEDARNQRRRRASQTVPVEEA